MTTCLIVEDHSITKEIFDEHAKSLGFKTIVTNNAEAALDACTENMPDCIILDWHMPGIDGVEFLKLLDSIIDGNKPKIIMCTCDDLVGQKEQLREIGVDSFIFKPVHFEDLKNELIKLEVLSEALIEA